MDTTMSKTTKNEVLEKLRRRYGTGGPEHRKKLIDQAVALIGYHRKIGDSRLGRSAGAGAGHAGPYRTSAHL
jgi:hypothetical protein